MGSLYLFIVSRQSVRQAGGRKDRRRQYSAVWIGPASVLVQCSRHENCCCFGDELITFADVQSRYHQQSSGRLHDVDWRVRSDQQPGDQSVQICTNSSVDTQQLNSIDVKKRHGKVKKRKKTLKTWSNKNVQKRDKRRSSATADGPRDAMCQSKSCQLLHNSVGTTCTTSPEQMEVMESEGYSRPTYNKLLHSATTRSTVVGVIHKLTVDDFCWPHRYTDDLLWQKFLSPKCRNYSRDLTTPLSGMIFIGRVWLAMINLHTKFEVSRHTRYEAMNGGKNVKNGGSLGRLKSTEGCGKCHRSIARIRFLIQLQ